MKLSILIPTLNRRQTYLNRLATVLKPQVKASEGVEVLILADNGESPVGKKRNELLEKATGDYIAFVDDDDLVSNNYVPLILKAIEKTPDVIGMHLIMTVDGIITGLTYHSLAYDTWWDEPTNVPNVKYYYRNPNHINPVRRELALKAKFPEINTGEDRQYSAKLLPFLKTEEYIYQPIYTYAVRTHKEV